MNRRICTQGDSVCAFEHAVDVLNAAGLLHTRLATVNNQGNRKLTDRDNHPAVRDFAPEETLCRGELERLELTVKGLCRLWLYLSINIQRLVFAKLERGAELDLRPEFLFEKFCNTGCCRLLPRIAVGILFDQLLHDFHLLRVMMVDGVELVLIDLSLGEVPGQGFHLLTDMV